MPAAGAGSPPCPVARTARRTRFERRAEREERRGLRLHAVASGCDGSSSSRRIEPGHEEPVVGLARDVANRQLERGDRQVARLSQADQRAAGAHERLSASTPAAAQARPRIRPARRPADSPETSRSGDALGRMIASNRARRLPARMSASVIVAYLKLVLLEQPARPAFVDVFGPRLVERDARAADRPRVLRQLAFHAVDAQAELARDRRRSPARPPSRTARRSSPARSGSRSPRSAMAVHAGAAPAATSRLTAIAPPLPRASTTQ